MNKTQIKGEILLSYSKNSILIDIENYFPKTPLLFFLLTYLVSPISFHLFFNKKSIQG
jgi:hypothetical protein